MGFNSGFKGLNTHGW